jgi:23S rRNA (pseudouridine1915-N3)-methyltransferase
VISSREKEQEQIRHDESEKMLAKIKSGDIVVVFDERGKKLSSEKFASQMASHIDTGTKQIIVVVGGAYGVTDAVRERANLVLAFSDMIFPHQLARIMALEQLYRAFSIRAGTKYHHD